jgi:hypothetical protein
MITGTCKTKVLTWNEIIAEENNPLGAVHEEEFKMRQECFSFSSVGS